MARSLPEENLLTLFKNVKSVMVRSLPEENLLTLFKNVKSVMVRSLPEENLLPLFLWWIIYFNSATEIAIWAALNCSLPQPATENGVKRTGRSNDRTFPTHLTGHCPLRTFCTVLPTLYSCDYNHQEYNLVRTHCQSVAQASTVNIIWIQS